MICIEFESADKKHFALHIQCFMRIIQGKHLLLTTHDLYNPVDDVQTDKEFDWTEIGVNQYDKILKETETHLLQQSVKEVFANDTNDFKLRLMNGYEIEVLADTAQDYELYRLIDKDDKHYAVSGTGEIEII